MQSVSGLLATLLTHVRTKIGNKSIHLQKVFIPSKMLDTYVLRD